MAILRNDYGRLIKIPPTPEQAGQLTACEFDFSFVGQAYTAATDFIEIGILPAYSTLIDFSLIGVAVNGNIAMGLMSGKVGDTGTRTCGAEYLAATAMTTTLLKPAAASAFLVPFTEEDRSIGIYGSADIAAGAKSFKLIALYAQGPNN